MSKMKGVINAKGVTVSTPLDPFALIFRKQTRDIGDAAAQFTASGKTRANCERAFTAKLAITLPLLHILARVQN